MSENNTPSRPFDVTEFSDQELHLARQILLALRRPLAPPAPPGPHEPPSAARNLYVEQRETDEGVQVRLVCGTVVALRCGEQVVYQDQQAEPLTEWVPCPPPGDGSPATRVPAEPLAPAPVMPGTETRVDALSRRATCTYDPISPPSWGTGSRVTISYEGGPIRALNGPSATTWVYDRQSGSYRIEPPPPQQPGEGGGGQTPG